MVYSNEYDVMDISEYSAMYSSNDYDIDDNSEFSVNGTVTSVNQLNNPAFSGQSNNVVPVSQLNNYEDPRDRRNRILGALLNATALGLSTAGGFVLGDLVGYGKAITAYELGKNNLKGNPPVVPAVPKLID